MPKISLIVSVYNKVRELELILTSLSLQTVKDFEVIIADDGSGTAMQDYINDVKTRFYFPILHIRQEDKGFRKSRILNLAINESNSDFLTFIDGDCIPHSRFIEGHVKNIKENTVLCGRRVFLNKEITDLIDTNYIFEKKIEKSFLKIFCSSVNKKSPSKHTEEALFIKSGFIRSLFRFGDTKLLGSNYSLPKELLIKINGFDENYVGAGIGEDSDIEYRLRLINAEFKSVRNLAIVYHLYHDKTVEEKKNYDYFQNIKKSGIYFCKNGLVKLNNL
ncbi:glycosyltransferase [bacterium]|nr:MAG: glycosyltransferase [bacterium]